VPAVRPNAPKPPAGPVVAEPYGRQAMRLNIRVEDINQSLARLKSNGDETAGPVEYDGIGKFAWCRTPGGHGIELWESA
jgi:predicted enzyme related to lactoylglutathione lyase